MSYQPVSCVSSGLGQTGGTLCRILPLDLSELLALAVMAMMRLVDNFFFLPTFFIDEFFIAREWIWAVAATNTQMGCTQGSGVT